MSIIKKIFYIVVSILIPELIGFLSSYLSGSGMKELYANLKKPVLSPPGYVFGIVWAALYALMGYASYRVLSSEADSKEKKTAMYYYVVQLFFNFMWSIIFFGMQMYTYSAFLIIIILVLVVITAYKFYKIDKIAGYIMIPYAFWVAFASYLNIFVAMNN